MKKNNEGGSLASCQAFFKNKMLKKKVETSFVKENNSVK